MNAEKEKDAIEKIVDTDEKIVDTKATVKEPSVAWEVIKSAFFGTFGLIYTASSYMLRVGVLIIALNFFFTWTGMGLIAGFATLFGVAAVSGLIWQAPNLGELASEVVSYVKPRYA